MCINASKYTCFLKGAKKHFKLLTTILPLAVHFAKIIKLKNVKHKTEVVVEHSNINKHKKEVLLEVQVNLYFCREVKNFKQI